MTAVSDFDRVVTAWLAEEAPAKAPEHTLQLALDRVAAAPQERYLTQRVFGDGVGRSRTLRLGLSVAFLLVALIASIAFVGSQPAPIPNSTPIGAYVPGPPLVIGRAEHTATLLADGRVLIAGGRGDEAEHTSSELWDPADGAFRSIGPLLRDRHGHTATLLIDGRVLLIGGTDEPTAEIWDPSTATSREIAAPAAVRRAHTATLLPDGRVLVIGGSPEGSDAAAEIWDPSTELFSPAGRPTVADRTGHTATLLPDGRVLVTGGVTGTCAPIAAEVWDPISNSFRPAGTPTASRVSHTATLLPDGRVVVVGGYNNLSVVPNQNAVDEATAETWDPRTETFSPAAPLPFPRSGHHAYLLPDGRLLLLGGWDDPPAQSGAWDPLTGAFAPVGSPTRLSPGNTSTLLADGRVLITGGFGRSSNSDQTVFWDPDAVAEPTQPATQGPPTPSPTAAPERSGGGDGSPALKSACPT